MMLLGTSWMFWLSTSQFHICRAEAQKEEVKAYLPVTKTVGWQSKVSQQLWTTGHAVRPWLIPQDAADLFLQLYDIRLCTDLDRDVEQLAPMLQSHHARKME